MGLGPGTCAGHVTIAVHQSKELLSHPRFQNYNVRGLNSVVFRKDAKRTGRTTALVQKTSRKKTASAGRGDFSRVRLIPYPRRN
jgi:hypothetical protein